MQEFEQLYMEYREDIYRFLLKLTGYEANLAEEIVQETFYQAYVSISKFKGQCQIKTWLCQIAKNTYFTYLRKNKRTIVSYDTLTEDYTNDTLAVSPQKQLEDNELLKGAIQIINSFDNKTKDIMLYRLCSDLPYSQIARVLGISENSAKVIYHRGKITLQHKLREVLGYEI